MSRVEVDWSTLHLDSIDEHGIATMSIAARVIEPIEYVTIDLRIIDTEQEQA